MSPTATSVTVCPVSGVDGGCAGVEGGGALGGVDPVPGPGGGGDGPVGGEGELPPQAMAIASARDTNTARGEMADT